MPILFWRSGAKPCSFYGNGAYEALQVHQPCSCVKLKLTELSFQLFNGLALASAGSGD